MTIEYETRLTVAAVSSVTLHILALSLYGIGRPAGLGSTGSDLRKPPLVIQLQRLEPQPIARLVDSAAPSEKPPTVQTDLIADKNTQAQDNSADRGDPHAPKVDLLGEFEELAKTLTTASSVPQTPVHEAPDTPAETPKPAQEGVQATANAPELPDIATEKPSEEPFQVARADARPIPESDLGLSRARDSGDAEQKGFLSFEAMQHEMAPYLQEVRDKVEKRWRIALDLYYSGTAPTQAVLDCAISPQGELVQVTVVDPGGALNFAPLCKEAIERAAPFKPFPFSVPDMYKSKNLEIRWTFNFL